MAKSPIRLMPDSMFERVKWALEAIAAAMCAPPIRMRCFVIVCYGDHLINCRTVGSVAREEIPGLLDAVRNQPNHYL